MPEGHAVVIVAEPRASHMTTASRATLQLSAPGKQTRGVHPALAPLPVQTWLDAAQSVVVREVPLALHSTSTSPVHARLPAVHVVERHAPATQVSLAAHEVTGFQLRPSAAHVWNPSAAQRRLPGVQSRGTQAPAVQAQPYTLPAHSARVAQGSNVAVAPRASHASTPSPSQVIAPGEQT